MLDGDLHLLRNLKSGLPVGWRPIKTNRSINLLERPDLSALYNADGKAVNNGVQLFHQPGTASGRAAAFVMRQGSYELTGFFTRLDPPSPEATTGCP